MAGFGLGEPILLRARLVATTVFPTRPKVAQNIKIEKSIWIYEDQICPKMAKNVCPNVGIIFPTIDNFQ